MFKQEKGKFLLLEVLTLFINTCVYRVLLSLHVSITISALVAFLGSMLCNYIGSLKYVFQDGKRGKLAFVLFYFYGGIGYFFKKMLISLFWNWLSFPLLIAKVIGFVVIMIYDYITKKSIFHWNYKIDRGYIKQCVLEIQSCFEKFISLKYIRFFFQFLPHNLFILIFFIGSIYYSAIFFRDNDDVLLYKQEISDHTIGPIINKKVDVSFSDVEIDADANRICLVFGTYGRNNDSNLTFELYDNNQDKVFQTKINTNILGDGKGFCLDVPAIPSDEIQNYHLEVISSNANKANNVTMFADKKTNQYTMYIKKVHPLFGIKHFILLFYVLVFLGINYLLNKKGSKISENKYLLMMLFYILSILFIYPPLENPDEPSHLFSAYNLSQNGFQADEKLEITVPTDIECLNYAHIQSRDRVVDYQEVKSCLENTDNKKVDSLFEVRNYVAGSALGHTPQAISIKVADTLTNSSLFIFYFARLGNFLVAFLLLYWAIKMAPVGKTVLLFIGVIPMFIQQETSLSYDALINSVVILFLSYMIKHLHSDEKIKAKDIFVPVMFFVVCLTVKMVYLPLLILLLFISKDKFKNNKQRIVYWVSIFGLSFLLNYIITKVLFVSSGVLANDAVSKQISYILNHPLQLIPIAFNTIKINGWYYLQGIVGFFSWFRFSLSNFTVLACIICFILLIFNENSLFDKKKSYQKWLLIVAVLISIAGVFASMYFCWSEYMLDYVDGVQGRYFIPLLGAIAIIMMPREKKFTLNKENVYLFINVLLLQYVMYSIIYFY